MKTLSLLLLIVSTSLCAQKPKVFTTEAGAINGYDPVAYFKEGKPMKGNENFSYSWNDAKWYFSSKENLDAFKSSPEKFAPQYGGYCAFGTSRGYKAQTSPDAFTILNEKLYLNYNLEVLKIWSKDKESFIKKADANWKEIEGK